MVRIPFVSRCAATLLLLVTLVACSREPAPLAAPEAAVPGGAAGAVAFTSRRDGNLEIYTAAADGSSPQRLTRYPGLDLAPAWSPDGRRLAFSRVGAGGADIWIVDGAGGAPVRVTRGRAFDAAPKWSADGSEIVFRRFEDLTSSALHAVAADGSSVRRLAD